MAEFLTSDDWSWRLVRTIVQGIWGVAIAYINVLVGCAVLDVTALVSDAAMTGLYTTL